MVVKWGCLLLFSNFYFYYEPQSPSSDRMKIFLSEGDFEIKSKIYSLNLRPFLNHILYSQDVLSFRNLFSTESKFMEISRKRLCTILDLNVLVKDTVA